MLDARRSARELLAAQGIEVTQATLSRDLAELGVLARLAARRARCTSWTAVHAQGEPAAPRWRERVLSCRENETLVVLHTRPGMASAVALRHRQRPDGRSASGTIAGDDTIFAPRRRPRRRDARARAADSEYLFGRENL